MARAIIKAIVIKKHKRLWIIERDGFTFPGNFKFALPYTPPDFIYKKIPSRQSLIELAESMHYADEVFEIIFEFESKLQQNTGRTLSKPFPFPLFFQPGHVNR